MHAILYVRLWRNLGHCPAQWKCKPAEFCLTWTEFWSIRRQPWRDVGRGGRFSTDSTRMRSFARRTVAPALSLYES